MTPVWNAIVFLINIRLKLSIPTYIVLCLITLVTRPHVGVGGGLVPPQARNLTCGGGLVPPRPTLIACRYRQLVPPQKVAHAHTWAWGGTGGGLAPPQARNLTCGGGTGPPPDRRLIACRYRQLVPPQKVAHAHVCSRPRMNETVSKKIKFSRFIVNYIISSRTIEKIFGNKLGSMCGINNLL